MVYSYYEAGRMIVEEEQGGKERAAYGKYILKELSQRLTQKFGRGYSHDNLKLMRKFYLVYSKDSIGETAFPQSEKLPVTQEGRKFYLSWSHYLILMRINNVDERHFYEIESYRNGWSKDELARQYGFCWRQVRLTFEEEHFRVDLVFYNRLLRCFVLFDLKIGQLKHQDIGQMQMYVNYYDRKVKLDDENSTIGIIICKDKKDAIVEMTLPEDNNQIFASKYETVLPSKEELQKLLEDKNFE